MAETRVLIIDGKNFALRMHYAHRLLRTQEGRPVSILYGGLDGLLNLARAFDYAPILFAWDGGGVTWRHTFSKGTYKANRKTPDPEMLEGLNQLPEFERILDVLGILQFKVPGLEGDDCVGILTTFLLREALARKVIICSTDRDYYQLLSDACSMVKRCDEEGKQVILPRDVVKEFGISPAEWTKFRALTGDKGDNIIQAQRGIGPKTAVRYLSEGVDPACPEFMSLPRAARAAVPHLASSWDVVHRNWVLSTIVRETTDVFLSDSVRKAILDYPLFSNPGPGAVLRRRTKNGERELVSWLADNEMTSLLARRWDFNKLS